MKRILFALSTLMFAILLASCLPDEIVPSPAAETAAPQSPATVTPASPAAGAGPIGVAVIQEKGALLAFYNFDGTLLGARPLPPAEGSFGYTHVAGPASAGLEALTVLRVRKNYPAVIVLADDREALRAGGTLNGFAAAPGQPVIAFGAVQPAGPGLLLSKIFLWTPATPPTAEPVFTLEGSYDGILTPLDIVMESGSPVGLWYTLCQYGIGGDIVFDPTHGLHYLDLATGLSTEFTIPGEEIRRPAFSPDGAWLSYVASKAKAMKFYDMQTGEIFAIPQLPESNRGGGNVTIAPDNHYVAWKEARGFRMGDTPDYHATLRVGVIGEGPKRDFNEAFFEQIAGRPVGDLTPLVWPNGQTLLVSLADENGARQVWILDLSGPTLRLLADGDFAGLLYP